MTEDKDARIAALEAENASLALRVEKRNHGGMVAAAWRHRLVKKMLHRAQTFEIRATGVEAKQTWREVQEWFRTVLKGRFETDGGAIGLSQHSGGLLKDLEDSLAAERDKNDKLAKEMAILKENGAAREKWLETQVKIYDKADSKVIAELRCERDLSRKQVADDEEIIRILTIEKDRARAEVERLKKGLKETAEDRDELLDDDVDRIEKLEEERDESKLRVDELEKMLAKWMLSCSAYQHGPEYCSRHECLETRALLKKVDG